MKLCNRAGVLVSIVAAALAVQAALSAASAQERTNYKDVYGNILSAVGLGQDRDPIDYTARAPIAVPPSNDLPPPVDAAAARRPAGFPNDPDVMARRKALADPRQPVPPGESGQARAYLIEPPSAYFDASAVAATGNQIDKGGTAAGATKHSRRHKKVDAEAQ